MRYGSVCSGIEAASVAWSALGWRAAFFSEIEKFPRAVLQQRFPSVPLHGDFTTIEPGDYDAIDLLVGGTPCQSFSVAGLRGGLGDRRGNLSLEYLRLADRLRPRWLVWENVPGVLSSTSHDAPDPCPPADPVDMGCDGAEMVVEDEYDSQELHAFNCFLAGVSELGYGFAYRVLDAQYTGVPQRRRRVFLVGYFGDWRPAAAVLFEPESLRGNSPPRRETGQRDSGSLSARTSAGGGLGTDFECGGGLTVGTLNANGKAAGSATQQDAESGLFVTHALRADGFDASEGGTGRGAPIIPILEVGKGSSSRGEGPNGAGFGKAGDPMFTLQRGAQHAVAFSCKDHGADAGDVAPTLRATEHDGSHANAGGQLAVAFEPRMRGDDGRGYDRAPHFSAESPALNTVKPPAIAAAMSVRRLTPRECERLQGFPDDYTLITRNGNSAADGPRYRALGNSMAVPVMAWIGQRIDLVEALLLKKVA